MDVLSQAIQFLSREPVVTVNGRLQVCPPSVDRLVRTADDPPGPPIASDEMSQTLCRASKATAGSLAAVKAPPPWLTVMPGRNPLV